MHTVQQFEKDLMTVYNKLNKNNWLHDDKVDYAEVMERLHKQYNYEGYEITDYIQELKESKLGLISLSAGREKTWIEIRKEDH